VLAQVVESTLIVCEDLGSSPMCATWMLFNCVFLCVLYWMRVGMINP